MSMSNYLETALCKHTAGIANFPMPTNLYLALLTSDPTDVGDLSGEVVAGDYHRYDLTGNLIVVNNIISNSLTIAFPSAISLWGNITHVAICDSSAVGNVLYHGALATLKTIDNGDVFVLLASNLTITLD